MTLAIVLDADAVAWFARQPSYSALLEAALADGRLRLLMPAAVKLQAEQTPDSDERDRRSQVVRLADTVGVPAALGSWVLGTDYLSSEEDSARHDRIRRKGTRENANHSRGDSVDALLVAAALDNSATLVTLDGSGRRPGLIQRARREGCQVMTPDELVRAISGPGPGGST